MNEALGIASDLAEKRMKYARYAYRAPMATAEPEAKPVITLEDVVRAAVDKYMGSVGKHVIEASIKSALSEHAIRWRDRQLKLQDVSEKAARYSVDSVIEIASQITGVPVDALRGPGRNRKVAWPRHFAIALLHCARRDLSYPQIGKIFGGRDHTTVMHALETALVRRLYPECESWYSDARAAAILAGTGYAL